VDHSHHFDIAILRSIDDNRLKERIGPKPNANSHIVILCYDPDCDEVGFEIRSKDERENLR
jgi:hypothetical protein